MLKDRGCEVVRCLGQRNKVGGQHHSAEPLVSANLVPALPKAGFSEFIKGVDMSPLFPMTSDVLPHVRYEQYKTRHPVLDHL